MIMTAIRSLIATMEKAKAVPRAVWTGKIVTGMATDLVLINESRYIAATYNDLQNAVEA